MTKHHEQKVGKMFGAVSTEPSGKQRANALRGGGDPALRSCKRHREGAMGEATPTCRKTHS